MPAFALTPLGAPATASTGPAGTIFARASAGTIAVTALGDEAAEAEEEEEEEEAGRVAPWA
jgi:hypothetical protein